MRIMDWSSDVCSSDLCRGHRRSGSWPAPDMGGGIDDRDGVARAVGDGIGDPEDLDATAFVVDASRHRAMDDCARAGLDRQVARNCAVEDETDDPMQRRVASDPAIEGDILLDGAGACDLVVPRAHSAAASLSVTATHFHLNNSVSSSPLPWP